jgi:hypothetical protein
MGRLSRKVICGQGRVAGDTVARPVSAYKLIRNWIATKKRRIWKSQSAILVPENAGLEQFFGCVFHKVFVRADPPR